MALNNYYQSCYSRLVKNKDFWNKEIEKGDVKFLSKSLYSELTTNECLYYYGKIKNTVDGLYALLQQGEGDNTIIVNPQDTDIEFNKKKKKR